MRQRILAIALGAARITSRYNDIHRSATPFVLPRIVGVAIVSVHVLTTRKMAVPSEAPSVLAQDWKQNWEEGSTGWHNACVDDRLQV